MPAAGGRRLLDGAETAQAVCVGSVRAPTSLDAHGWRATLEVERVLAGPLQPGEPIAIAWEELAAERPLRFADGMRVLVALEPLPSGSLWRARVPQRDALAVADHGDAFLRDPDPATVAALGAYLAVPPAQRGETAGARTLAALAARAEARVAAAALARLAALPGLAARLDPAGLAELRGLLGDPARPAPLRRDALDLVGRAGLGALEDEVAALAAQPGPVRGAALEALGRLRGGLPPEEARRLEADPDPAVRRAVLVVAPEAVADATLRVLLRRDADPGVRTQAVEVLLARRGELAVGDGVAALRDPSPEVRTAAVQALGRVGEPAVPALREAVWAPGATPDDVAAPLAALIVCGPAGLEEARRVAHEHPDPHIRGVARLLMGQEPQPRH